MPDITVYMNCDTRLAINLQMFDLQENDEFIFAIKNYNYIESPAVFLFRARSTDMDENGEVLFKITPEASKKLKPKAFYNFSILKNAFNEKLETEYKRLTDNGAVILEYGAHDLALDVVDSEQPMFNEIVNMRLELIDDVLGGSHHINGEVVGIRLECLENN
jgi:hypothetical protein